MSDLASKQCIPCKGGVPPFTRDQINNLIPQIPSWSPVNDHHLTRAFTLPDFKSALALVNRIGDLAEAQGHHPDIYLAWGMVRIEIWTHKISTTTLEKLKFHYAGSR